MKLGSILSALALGLLLLLRRRQLSGAVSVLLGLAAVALLLTGVDLIRPPGVEEIIRESAGALGSLIYPVVGLFAFAESGAFVGLVAPGELVVLLGGVSAGQGEVDPATLALIVWGAALTGDVVSFLLGRRFGHDILLRHGAGLGITRARLDQVAGFLHRHGVPTIFVGRFIGVVRALAPFVAGSSRMPARRFLPAAVVASGVWAGCFTALGYAFGNNLDALLPIVEHATLALGILAALVVLLGVLRAQRPSAGTA